MTGTMDSADPLRDAPCTVTGIGTFGVQSTDHGHAARCLAAAMLSADDD